MSGLLALKIVGLGALLGFGTTTIVRARRARRRAPRSLGDCVEGVWSPSTKFDPPAISELSLPAVMTLRQFPGFYLDPEVQADAIAVVQRYVDSVKESDADGGMLLEFPSPQESTIVHVDRALDRVESYMRFSAAAAAAAVAPDCAWPDPMSDELPEEPRAAAVWQSLERLAVVALAERDGAQIRVDVDPQTTILDDFLEACVPDDVVLPLRSATTLAPELGDDHDPSWQISHGAQVNAFSVLQERLADPHTTAPASAAVAAVAPGCPWGDKTRYGLAMTTLWYDVRRLERFADMKEAA